ncbi:MAG: hypothetical protein M3R06_04940 [Chloroflexota bacterium]|nr:hypothetical protein [Chloroflexota bacterium]
MRIIVSHGHRNRSGGDPGEAARTPALAKAIVAALKAAGHQVIDLQNDDGRADDWFDGTLDAVARRVMWYDAQKPVDLLLDIHLEGDPASTPGVFAIFPDGDGLRTLTPYQGSDAAAANGRDRAAGIAIAAAVAQRTGLRLRTRNVVAPGLMSERQTYVGADLGWRLAMFGYTAPARAHMARLVLECGNLYADRAIIDGAGFAGRVAGGVVAGIAKPGVGAPRFGTQGTLPQTKLVTVTAEWLRVRTYAELSQPIITQWPAGTQFLARGWVIGESVAGNPLWWIVAGSGWRVWSGGTDGAVDAA